MRMVLLVAFLFEASNAFAADLTLFLQQSARTGPSCFVQWAEQYYAERKQGKSGFQESERKVGTVAGAIMGGAVGSLKDDMLSGMKNGFNSGKKYGGQLGEAYGVVEGRSQKMENLITDYVNDRQPLLDAIEKRVLACMQGGTKFSSCRMDQSVVALQSKIADLNNSYCRQAVAIPSPLDHNKRMLSPQLCNE